MSDDDDPDKTYKVGYCRPPLHSQYRPGTSGNPAGSSKRVRNRDESILENLAASVKKYLSTTVPAKINGRAVEVSGYDACAIALGDRSMRSDKSLKYLLELEKLTKQFATASAGVDVAAIRASIEQKLNLIRARIREDQPKDEEDK